MKVKVMINRTVEELFASHRHTERTPSQLLSIFRYPSERLVMMMMIRMATISDNQDDDDNLDHDQILLMMMKKI